MDAVLLRLNTIGRPPLIPSAHYDRIMDDGHVAELDMVLYGNAVNLIFSLTCPEASGGPSLNFRVISSVPSSVAWTSPNSSF